MSWAGHKLFRSAVGAGLFLAAAGPAQAQLRTEPYVSGFSFPVAFVQDPGDRKVQYVVEQGGRIRAVRDGTVMTADFLDLSDQVAFAGEQGLLGLAFAPDYAASGRFFVNFTDRAGNTVVARFRRSASNPLIADSNSRFDLRWRGANGPAFIFQPYANHNGGNLAFGPDGFLYIGMGDGGAGDDPQHRAQDPFELLGKMLRIDVNVADDNPVGYEAPSGNPFIGRESEGFRPEIWSFGLRNPWRYSFDDPALGGTGALLIGDVGQGQWEEVDYEPPIRGGRNYGWRNREGANEYITSRPPAYLPLVDPIYQYNHNEGGSITGGYVYRGRTMGAFYRGRYFFADFSRGRVWSIALAIDPVTGEAGASGLIEHTAELGGRVEGGISSFGQDADGELYIVAYSPGAVIRISPVEDRNSVVPVRAGDFDGDGKADLTLYRPSEGYWSVLGSGANYTAHSHYQWGISIDITVPGDYDGDGKTDLAVYRPDTGVWHIVLSSAGSTTYISYQWGLSTDIPVPGDYDGDGRTDIAVYRPTTGLWYVLASGTNFTTLLSFQWGAPADIPVPGDYDGDAKTDVAVYRPGTGVWYALLSSSNSTVYVSYQWGVSTDVPVANDYDGDGKTDFAVYRPDTAFWHVLMSTTAYTTYLSFQWGAPADIPVADDYDGDGRTDFAVYRPDTGFWHILMSTTGYSAWVSVRWGPNSGKPAPQLP